MCNSDLIEALLTLDCHLCVAAGFKMGPLGCKQLELGRRVGRGTSLLFPLLCLAISK